MMTRSFTAACILSISFVSACEPSDTDNSLSSDSPKQELESEQSKVNAPTSESPTGEDRLKARGLIEKAAGYMISGPYIEAIPVLDDAIALDPSNPKAHLFLGRALLANTTDRDPNEACECFKTAMKLGNPGAEVWLARVHLLKNETQEASRSLDNFLSKNEEPSATRADALQLKASLVAKAGKHDEAQRLMLEASGLVQSFINSPELSRYPLISSHLRQIAKSIELESARLSQLRGSLDKAVLQAKSYVEKYSADEKGRALLSEIYEASGISDDAQKQLRAIELIKQLDGATPKDSDDIDALEKVVAELEVLAPEHRRASCLFARACLNCGASDRAIQACQRARLLLEFAPRTEDTSTIEGESWFLEGRAHHNERRAEEALACYKKSAEIVPGFRSRYEELKKEIEAHSGQAHSGQVHSGQVHSGQVHSGQ